MGSIQSLFLDTVIVCAGVHRIRYFTVLMGDHEKADIIMALDEPQEIKRTGKHVQNFNAERWEEACQAIVERGNMEKVYLPK